MSTVEPLARRQDSSKAVVEAEEPDLVILGKQAIDDDCQPDRPDAGGAIGLGRRATFASEIETDGDGNMPR